MIGENNANLYRRSIGEFLCVHPPGPPIENVDWPSSLDIRQDAALRALIALRKLGKEVSVDAVASFDAEPKLVAMIYRWARQDALKRQAGRGASDRPTIVRELSEAIPDPRSEIAIDAADEWAASDLCEQRIPGLTYAQSTRVLVTMREIQESKDAGISPIPAILRSRACRLRRETRLPLDTRLL